MARLGQTLYSQQNRVWIIKGSLKEYFFRNIICSSWLYPTDTSPHKPSQWTLFSISISYIPQSLENGLVPFLLPNATSEPFLPIAFLKKESIDTHREIRWITYCWPSTAYFPVIFIHWKFCLLLQACCCDFNICINGPAMTGPLSGLCPPHVKPTLATPSHQ